MANSSIISKAKNIIIKELIKNKQILLAIDSKSMDINTPEKFINTHIFNYHQNPYTLNDAMTFITIQVHIPNSFVYGDYSSTFVKPVVEIWIISNEKHMNVDNIPKVKENRNDYIAELIDQQFNGRLDFGYGELILQTNIEGAFQHSYLYRKLTFEVIDINKSLCRDEI